MENKEIIREWYSLYANDVYNYLVYYLNNTDAEDILQEVFIKAMHSLDRFQGKSHPKTWLIQIARNIAIDQSRRNKRFTDILKHINKTESHLSVEKSLIDNEEVLELYQYINKLSPKYREIVILKGILELNTKEIAIVTGYKENNINLTFHRAKQKLKDFYFGRSVIKNESI
ncbi:RNA polymerase sigma factor [Cytobacillus purgationiresistens]|uniref:RNA polymerase sigma factor n=1 Tax=Cytobacillus purgationiresistens TaxID=863449 RepID=A0ABU0AIB4_9BACI|nr:RNA polymerase sigma factor [Cytobacillus purgationiresistens]MDQ0270962.1 RNA polymerase sigma-70 factor (ECF subfamily) [Cytobacillus purgationiresistens]